MAAPLPAAAFGFAPGAVANKEGETDVEMSRQWRKTGVCAVLVLLFCTSSVSADSGRRGEGILRAADAQSRTLRVNRRILTVGPSTQIVDSRGVVLADSELWDRVGDPVRYVAGGGTPYPILQRIVLEDPEEAQ